MIAWSLHQNQSEKTQRVGKGRFPARVNMPPVKGGHFSGQFFIESPSDCPLNLFQHSIFISSTLKVVYKFCRLNGRFLVCITVDGLVAKSAVVCPSLRENCQETFGSKSELNASILQVLIAVSLFFRLQKGMVCVRTRAISSTSVASSCWQFCHRRSRRKILH